MTYPPPTVNPVIFLGFLIPLAIAAAICYYLAKRDYEKTLEYSEEIWD
ncbi:MAG: hypothetical protein ACFFD6_02530 [Candidatus Thorarchaeota archaeon]